MNAIIKILLVIFILTSCQSRQTDNKSKDLTKIELNQNLIDEFFSDERLRSDNPDFEYYRVKEFAIDLNDNQIKDSIILNQIRGFENDPGVFHQIQIKLDNGSILTQTNFDGWVKFDDNYLVPESVKKQNQISTDLLLLTEFNKTKILGLFSWVYASDNGLLTFIEFSADRPRIMFNTKMDLIEIDSSKIITQQFDDKYEIKLINSKLTMEKI